MSKEPEDFQETEGIESMDIDSVAISERFSEPYFLGKVLEEELGDDCRDHRLLAIAVHAVLLDSGFVGFDPVSKLRIDRFHLPDEWPSPVSICYSLPELLKADGSSGSNLTDYVVLEFQSLRHKFMVYGSLGKGGSGIYNLTLNEHEKPSFDLVWAYCDRKESTNANKDLSFNSYPENAVFEFWKIVKDGLALPLLIDLCYTTGLNLPPCLINLPTDLKLKIMGSLPGVDIARMACACQEMRYLASNNDLWKQKFEEEFKSWSGPLETPRNWKNLFCARWKSRKKENNAITLWQRYPRVDVDRPYYLPIRRDPNLFGVPLVIGGDYDCNFFPPLIAASPPAVVPRRRNAGFRCNLGERQNNP